MLSDEIVADLHMLGMTPRQVFRRLVPIVGQEEATRAIALHVMRLRIVAAIEEEQEDPIQACSRRYTNKQQLQIGSRRVKKSLCK